MARATGRSLVTECLRDTHPGGEPGGEADRRGRQRNHPDDYQDQPPPRGKYPVLAAPARRGVHGGVERNAERDRKNSEARPWFAPAWYAAAGSARRCQSRATSSSSSASAKTAGVAIAARAALLTAATSAIAAASWRRLFMSPTWDGPWRW